MTHTPPPTQDDLSAGRELDARVAEKIFGYVAWAVPRHSGAHAGDVVWLMQPRDAILAPPPDLPCYSTDISVAMQVAEHMNQRGYYWELSQGLTMPDGDLIWQANLRRWDRVMGWRGVAQSLPLAICRAALDAVSQSRLVNESCAG